MPTRLGLTATPRKQRLFLTLGGVTLATVGHGTLTTAALNRLRKFWRVPSNAPLSTAARMVVMAAGANPATVSQEGAVTADASGNFDLATSDASADQTKRLAVVHDWGGNTATTNIRGGPAIATLNEVVI